MGQPWDQYDWQTCSQQFRVSDGKSTNTEDAGNVQPCCIWDAATAAAAAAAAAATAAAAAAAAAVQAGAQAANYRKRPQYSPRSQYGPPPILPKFYDIARPVHNMAHPLFSPI